MSEHNKQLVRDFFTAIAAGELPDALVASDMTAWTVSSGDTDRARFQGGVKLLSAIFGGTLVYTLDALTAEEDRVVAQARSHGTLVNGEPFENNHVFLFRLRYGQIVWVAEFMNQFTVRDKIVPLMQSFMAKQQG